VSGLKYIGLGNTAMAVAGGHWLLRVRPIGDRAPAAADPVLAAEAEPPVTAVPGPDASPALPGALRPGRGAVRGLRPRRSR
jgi:hypothetical protein